MTTKTTRRRSVSTLLDLARPVPAGRWTLSLALAFSGGTRTGTADIAFFCLRGLFSGEADMIIDMGGDGIAQIPVDIEGEATGDAVSLDVYMKAPGFPHPGFFCHGTLAAEDWFRGRYTMPCAAPKECGCDGMDGTFSLFRTE